MGQAENTTYDAYGREATHMDFKGQQEVFHYDSLGRVDFELNRKDLHDSSASAAAMLQSKAM